MSFPRALPSIWLVLATLLPAQGDADGALKSVLLIGDVSWNSHFQNVQKALKGEAELVRAPLGHLSSGAALARVDELLQGRRWDVICCNVGLSDLMYRDHRTKRIRAMAPGAGGVQVTSLESYGENLAKLVARLRRSSGRLLWLTTRPLNPRQRSGAIVAADIARYNEVASSQMTRLGAEVVDVHAQIEAELSKAEDRRARERLHGQLFKKDLSGPLVARISRQ